LPAASVQDVRARADTYVDQTFSRDDSTLIADIIRPLIISNQVVDQTRTQQARDAARKSVAPVQVSFAENQIIVEKDSPFTAEAREALIEAGLVGDAWTPELIGASVLLGVIAASTIAAGIRAFRPRADSRQLLLIGLVIAIPVFVLKVYLPLILPDDERHFLAYILPVSVSSMVLAGFIGAEVALLGAAMIAFLTAFVAVLLLDVTVVGIAGSLEIARLALVSGIASAAGVFAVRNAERLAQFLFGGLLVGLSIFVILCATWLLEPGHELRDIAWIVLAASANGGLSAFISAGAFVTLGTAFGVTTRVQLLEMSQLNQPLLLRLQDEAPSTFQHSIIMANMAEKGAHVIGADALVTRVGCYYHDIGKLARPGFFIENQMGGPNPHDALEPGDSARIIADHVIDGMNLGRQHKLPPRILAFIPEHHGTRMVSYFYRKAYEEDPTVNPDSFRYPGPKPQSRETAIAMLADSSEAAVRSNPDHSPEAIEELVDSVFSERLSEGQLDESDLTLRDIRSLAQSFKSTLKAMYHPRIEYPAPSEAELLLRKLPFRRYSENS
jgi:putative nucleotidyltransferase with HDIG domain